VKVVRWSVRTVVAGADLRFLGKQPTSDVTKCTPGGGYQARGYLPSRRSSSPFGRYQFILLGGQRYIYKNNLPKVVI